MFNGFFMSSVHIELQQFLPLLSGSMDGLKFDIFKVKGNG
jgi:hypothetical protein